MGIEWKLGFSWGLLTWMNTIMVGSAENIHSYIVTIATFVPELNIFDLRSWGRLELLKTQQGVLTWTALAPCFHAFEASFWPPWKIHLQEGVCCTRDRGECSRLLRPSEARTWYDFWANRHVMIWLGEMGGSVKKAIGPVLRYAISSEHTEGLKILSWLGISCSGLGLCWVLSAVQQTITSPLECTLWKEQYSCLFLGGKTDVKSWPRYKK